MLDLDRYLKESLDVKIKGKVVEVLQPTAKMTKEINRLERDMNEDNYLEIKGKVALKILNNNESGEKFTLEDIDNIPFKLTDFLIKELTSMVYKADNDPN